MTTESHRVDSEESAQPFGRRANFAWPAAALTAVSTRLRRQGKGRIFVLSSVAGNRVRGANFVYGSGKAGLDVFAVVLGEALRGSGVSVHVVRPGFVHTKMTDGLPATPFAIGPDEWHSTSSAAWREVRP